MCVIIQQLNRDRLLCVVTQISSKLNFFFSNFHLCRRKQIGHMQIDPMNAVTTQPHSAGPFV